MAKVKFVRSETGDWEWCYIDGVCVIEGHSIQNRELLNALGITNDSRVVKQQWAEDHGLPRALKDIPEEAYYE